MDSPLQLVVIDAAADCAWALLGSVGMSSSRAVDVPFAVVPEDALLLAAIGATGDPRLGDEARDWFVVHDDLVSRPALKSRLSYFQAMGEDAWAKFATPLVGHVRGALPGVDPEDGRAYVQWRPGGKARRSVDARLASGVLRYRAALGTQARADALFRLAARTDDPRGWTADEVARSVAQRKPAIRDALAKLAEGGIVRRARVGNTDRYSIADVAAIERVFGAARLPAFDAIDLPALVEAADLAAAIIAADDLDSGTVTARGVLSTHRDALTRIGLELPTPGPDLDRQRVEIEQLVRSFASGLADPSQPTWPKARESVG